MNRIIRMSFRRQQLQPFRIQYVSDIHLEMYDKHPFPLIVTPAAKYLALCGDIGHPDKPIFRSFLEYCSQRWEKVFYVPGNHEYYSGKMRSGYHKKMEYKYSMTQIDALIRTTITEGGFKNVYYLNNEIVELPEEELNILGTPLWTDIPYEKFEEAKERLNDMKYIANFTPEVMKGLHTRCSSWLMDALWQTNAQGRKAIVLTHHMPSELLVASKYKGDRYGYLFYTEMTGHLAHPALVAWICGHSHSCEKIVYRPDVTLYMNARGYPGESIPGFSSKAIADPSRDSLLSVLPSSLSLPPPPKEEPIEFM